MSKRYGGRAMSLVRMDDMGDPWGTYSSHLFGMCEALWHAGESIPGEWEFRHSPITDCSLDWPDSEYAEMLTDGTVTADELRHVGHVLDRMRALCVLAGRDY